MTPPRAKTSYSVGAPMCQRLHTAVLHTFWLSRRKVQPNTTVLACLTACHSCSRHSPTRAVLICPPPDHAPDRHARPTAARCPLPPVPPAAPVPPITTLSARPPCPHPAAALPAAALPRTCSTLSTPPPARLPPLRGCYPCRSSCPPLVAHHQRPTGRTPLHVCVAGGRRLRICLSCSSSLFLLVLLICSEPHPGTAGRARLRKYPMGKQSGGPPCLPSKPSIDPLGRTLRQWSAGSEVLSLSPLFLWLGWYTEVHIMVVLHACFAGLVNRAATQYGCLAILFLLPWWIVQLKVAVLSCVFWLGRWQRDVG